MQRLTVFLIGIIILAAIIITIIVNTINIIGMLVYRRRYNAFKFYDILLQYKYIPKHLLSFTIYSYIYTYLKVLLNAAKAINYIEFQRATIELQIVAIKLKSRRQVQLILINIGTVN